MSSTPPLISTEGYGKVTYDITYMQPSNSFLLRYYTERFQYFNIRVCDHLIEQKE